MATSHIERIGAAKGELADAFAGLLAELRAGMLTEYTASVEVLREQAYLEYRGRLGKLAEELTAKHRVKEPERPVGAPAARPRR